MDQEERETDLDFSMESNQYEIESGVDDRNRTESEMDTEENVDSEVIPSSQEDENEETLIMKSEEDDDNDNKKDETQGKRKL